MLRLVLAIAGAALGTAFAVTPPTHADPAWPNASPGRGKPMPQPPPGCVQENGLPCSGAPSGLNATRGRNPAICALITHGGWVSEAK